MITYPSISQSFVTQLLCPLIFSVLFFTTGIKPDFQAFPPFCPSAAGIFLNRPLGSPRVPPPPSTRSLGSSRLLARLEADRGLREGLLQRLQGGGERVPLGREVHQPEGRTTRRLGRGSPEASAKARKSGDGRNASAVGCEDMRRSRGGGDRPVFVLFFCWVWLVSQGREARCL